MNLRFFADQCIPNMIIKLLRNKGYEVFRLKDCIPPDSPDQIVVSEAKKLNSILISINGDFADIITYPPSNYNGIICLQIKNHPELIPLIMEILNNYLKIHVDMEHFKGKLFLVEAYRIRVRE